jgi:predicted amidohydrolase
MRTALTVAAVQPDCTPGDVTRNALGHADAVRAARARLVVFPELSLTGYVLDAAPVAIDDPALTPLADACAATGSVALAGAPVADEEGRVYIATLHIDEAGVRVAYRKTWLGGGEPGRFTPGGGPVALDVDGWRLGLGICRDTRVFQHVADVAALRVDLYAAGLVHAPEELPDQDAQAAVIARTCGAHVVFASFAGPTGTYPETAGSSAVWSPAGQAIARAGTEPGGIARATLIPS